MEGKIVSRGFLIGPYCPIYGLGGLIITYLIQPYFHDSLALFIVTMLVASILEYTASYIMEKLFHTRWWDYSQFKFNINGRISLLASSVFGLFALVAVYFINPFYLHLLNQIPSNELNMLSAIIFIVFSIDFIISITVLFQVKKDMKVVHKDCSDEVSDKVRKVINKKINNFLKFIS
jgi:uncharacterized membrane protein